MGHTRFLVLNESQWSFKLLNIEFSSGEVKDGGI